MLNNYQKGRAKEYRIKQKLKKEGYYTIRSAGSHSYFDLIAINKEKKEILLIQVKSNKTKKIEEFYQKLNNEFSGQYTVKVVLL